MRLVGSAAAQLSEPAARHAVLLCVHFAAALYEPASHSMPVVLVACGAANVWEPSSAGRRRGGRGCYELPSARCRNDAVPGRERAAGDAAKARRPQKHCVRLCMRAR